MSIPLLRASRSLSSLLIRRSIMHGTALPKEAKVKLEKPSGSGFFSYSRNWSRDKQYDLSKAPQKGDTATYFMLRRLGHAYEVYPLIFLTGVWVCLFTVATYTAFNKAEVWLDRSKSKAPWDWSRIRDKYNIIQTVHPLAERFVMPEAKTHKRLEIMEKLQDEMLEAAQRRGTRK